MIESINQFNLRSINMKKFAIAIALAASTLATPVLSFAQANDPVTRAEVRADLAQVERARYVPSTGNDDNYPAGILAAEAKVAATQGDGQLANQSYGGVAQGSSSSGMSKHAAMRSSCVGPVSFCNVYFGS
jgi:hypothetical protein